MKLVIGSDHAGFPLKEQVRAKLLEEGHEVIDLGAYNCEASDYPDYAEKVGLAIKRGDAPRGILICGSGAGVDIAANKFRGIRSVLAFSPDQAGAAKADDDTNILALPSDFLELDTAKRIVSVWLQTPVSAGDKYKRRLEKIRTIEQKIKNQ